MKSNRLLVLFLVAVLVLGLFSACGSDSQANTSAVESTDASPADASEVSADVSVEAVGDAEPDAAEPDAFFSEVEAEELILPLSDDLVTLTGYRQFQSSGSLTDLNDNEALKELENRTNVHIDWTTFSGMDNEPFNLFIASQDYTDMFFINKTYYNGGIDKAIEDDVYLSGNDYLELMPNFTGLMNSNPEIAKQSKTDAGNVYFVSVSDLVQPPYLGPLVRGDWLDDLGLDVPVTYDDWKEMLTAFKNEKNASAPAMISTNGYSTMSYCLTSGYHTAGEFYAENGTKVKFGFLEDSMKDYLQMMNQWYTEGIIDRDFFSHNSFMDGETLYANDNTGAFEENIYIMMDNLQSSNSDPNNYLIPVPYPSQTESDQGSLHFGQKNFYAGDNVIFISSAAVARGVDELCARWIDYRYSDEGALLLNYGIEGKTYELNESGEPEFTDFFLHNETYTPKEMMDAWTEMGYGNLYHWYRENQLYSDDVLAAYDVWGGSSKCDWVMPSITMTAEEAETFGGIYNDISVYIDETVLQFITGTKSFDEWEDFTATIESMGIQDCIDIKQDALDRYNSR